MSSVVAKLHIKSCVSGLDSSQLCVDKLHVPFTHSCPSFVITGEFGVVYKAQYTEPEGDIGYKTSTVAVKTLKGGSFTHNLLDEFMDTCIPLLWCCHCVGFFDNSQVNKIMEESIKMKHFDHPNVLHLIGVCLDAGPAPYVVMPYMANGSLLHYLKKERNNIVLPVGVDEDVVG